MTIIKFSHKYNKMPDGFEESTLLQVLILERDELTEAFELYDTQFIHPKGNGVSKYPLPYGKLIVLLLLSTTKILWTTIRSWDLEKEQYYKGLCGQRIKCEVK